MSVTKAATKIIDKKQFDYIRKIIDVSILCGIEAVSIETNVVRGQAEDNSKGIFLIETGNVPTFEFEELAITRVKVLKSRLSLLDESNLKVEYLYNEKDNGGLVVKKLKLSSGRTKTELSCGKSSMIKSPATLKDKKYFNFTLTSDTFLVMSKAAVAIETTNITFSTQPDGTVSFRASDNKGDMFDHLVSDSFSKLPDADVDDFSWKYGIRWVLPLFKAASDANGEVNVTITRRGILEVVVKGLTIYILPETEDDD